MMNYHDTGMSVLEMSHRGPTYDHIHNEALKDLRDLMDIPDNYEVLFMQGGATAQFSTVPINLTQSNDDIVNYLTTGVWCNLAA